MYTIRRIDYEDEVVTFFLISLPGQCENIFYERHGERRSVPEIAESWDVSQEWVEIRLATAKRLIKERLHATLESESTSPLHSWKERIFNFIAAKRNRSDIDYVQLESRFIRKIYTALYKDFCVRTKSQWPSGYAHQPGIEAVNHFMYMSEEERYYLLFGKLGGIIIAGDYMLFQNESILSEAEAMELVFSHFSSTAWPRDDFRGVMPDEIWEWNGYKEQVFRLKDQLNVIISSVGGGIVGATLTHSSAKDWITQSHGLGDALPDGGFDGWKRQILVSSDTNEYQIGNCLQ